jgi:hypothetical protein
MCEIHGDKLCIEWVLSGMVLKLYRGPCDIAPAGGKIENYQPERKKSGKSVKIGAREGSWRGGAPDRGKSR